MRDEEGRLVVRDGESLERGENVELKEYGEIVRKI